jgi:predicted Zn-dependent protease
MKKTAILASCVLLTALGPAAADPPQTAGPADRLAIELARQLQASGRLDDAERQLAPVAQRRALGHEGITLLGEIAAERGRWQNAEAYYRAALALAPNEAGLHLRLGQALQSQGRTQEADAAFQRYRELTE